MKTFGHGLACVAVSVAVTNCGKDHDHKKEPPQPEVLSLESFRSSSFADLPWEQKCSGTQEFFEDFQRVYLPEVKVSFSKYSCSNPVNSFDTFYDLVDVVYSRNGLELNLMAQLMASFDAETLNLAQQRPDLDRRDGVTGSDYVYETKDASIGANLFHLSKTFAAWLTAEPKGPVTILGYTYPDYLARIQQEFGPESEGLDLDSPDVTFKLIPGAEGLDAGTVQFTAADLTHYPRKTMLDCKDLACLQSQVITYKVAGTVLVLEGPSVPDGDVNGIPLYTAPIFRVYLDFLKK